jgi:Raf kinase inhibitor-like YbhB/YbcL family protein
MIIITSSFDFGSICLEKVRKFNQSSLTPSVRHISIRFFILAFSCLYTTATLAQEGELSMSMTLKSPRFSNQDEIPKIFTCDGDDISPALKWSDLPQNTKSLVLIVDDPDAPDPAKPKMTWVHWLLYNIPPEAAGLKENISAAELPGGTKEGMNDWKRTGYGGPCPPIGRHRYFYKLYALDVILPDLHKPDKASLEKAMAGHIISETELIGTYQR